MAESSCHMLHVSGRSPKEGGALHSPFSSPRGSRHTPQGYDAICHSCAHLFVRMRHLRFSRPRILSRHSRQSLHRCPRRGVGVKGRQTTSFHSDCSSDPFPSWSKKETWLSPVSIYHRNTEDTVCCFPQAHGSRPKHPNSGTLLGAPSICLDSVFSPSGPGTRGRCEAGS